MSNRETAEVLAGSHGDLCATERDTDCRCTCEISERVLAIENALDDAAKRGGDTYLLNCPCRCHTDPLTETHAGCVQCFFALIAAREHDYVLLATEQARRLTAEKALDAAGAESHVDCIARHQAALDEKDRKIERLQAKLASVPLQVFDRADEMLAPVRRVWENEVAKWKERAEAAEMAHKDAAAQWQDESRLRRAAEAEVERLKKEDLAKIDGWTATMRRADEAEARERRLREALEKIVERGTRLIAAFVPPLPHEIGNAYGEVDRIAREALSKE